MFYISSIAHSVRGGKKNKMSILLQHLSTGTVVRVNRGNSHCQSLMSHSVLKAGLHIVVTLKEPAGYLAERFISVGAVEAGGLGFTLWFPPDAAISLWGNKPQTWMSLFESAKDSPLNPDTPFCSAVYAFPLGEGLCTAVSTSAESTQDSN